MPSLPCYVYLQYLIGGNMITRLNIEHLSCLVARIEGDLPSKWNGHLSAVAQKQVSGIHGHKVVAGFGVMKPALRHLEAGFGFGFMA